jgi:hypothetical protein
MRPSYRGAFVVRAAESPSTRFVPGSVEPSGRRPEPTLHDRQIARAVMAARGGVDAEH